MPFLHGETGMNERLALERAACNYFLDSYNRLHDTAFEIVDHRDKPDFWARDTRSGEKIGIEVTHLFFDSREAKILLGRSPDGTHGTMTISELIERLNDLLAQKITQTAKYNFEGRLFLLVRVASPIFDKKDFEIFEDEITFPPGNVLDEVWLLFLNQTTQTYNDLMQVQ